MSLREKIMEVLVEAKVSLSASQIHEQIKGIYGWVSLAQVRSRICDMKWDGDIKDVGRGYTGRSKLETMYELTEQGIKKGNNRE